MNSVGSTFSLNNNIHTRFDVLSLDEKLETSRLQAENTNLCVEWARDISSDGSYRAESIWKPIDFDFLVVAPSMAHDLLKGAQNKTNHAPTEDKDSLYAANVEPAKGRPPLDDPNLRGSQVA